ncbi:MAG: Gfo/Idh/MocA family oxidoreductase [Sphaerochaetaceae bacterium]
MMEPVRIALLGAGNRGRRIYADYAKSHPQELKVVAIAEPDDVKRGEIVTEHDIRQEYAVKDWHDLFREKLPIEAVVIAIQDAMHRDAILACIEKNYHILCEKPIVTTYEDSRIIADASKKFKKVFVIAHVLRYSPFFTRVKQLVAQGEIGRLIGIELDECVGHIHMSHSFVRGNWRDSTTSAPMILAKSCHDMDILLYLAAADCESLSSYGDLHYFTAENAPKNAPARCTDNCPHVEECPYAAQKIYLGKNIGWPVNIITTDLSIEGRLKALKEGPWGRCVFHCDNNVVDHQTVNAKFTNGVVATFTMSGFTMDTHRSVRLMGTDGELIGNMEKGTIAISNFSSRDKKTIEIETPKDGHSGSDARFVADFVHSVRNNNVSGETSIGNSLQSHYMAFAAETSRLADGERMMISQFSVS